MDSLRSSVPMPSRQSRRSFPSLNHISLAPLSSRFPIDDDGYEQAQQSLHRSSYIQETSAPTTPGILQDTHNPPPHHGQQMQHYFTHDPYAPSLDVPFDPALARAKSSSALLYRQSKRGRPSKIPSYSHSCSSKPHRSEAATQDEDWVHRAGLVIASEMRDSKGQGWLASRSSSTSLTAYQPSSQYVRADRATGDDSEGESTPRRFSSRNGSRVTSRAVSARTSRRGSRAGSRVELTLPAGAKYSAELLEVEDQLDDGANDEVEPDFLEKEEEDDDEGLDVNDGDIARLATAQGIGFGGLVDRIVGLSLFNLDETDETDEDGAGSREVDEPSEGAKMRRDGRRKRHQELIEKAQRVSRVENARAVRQDGEDGWADAAWLLSVASKVLL